jgi:hypothetical protein
MCRVEHKATPFQPRRIFNAECWNAKAVFGFVVLRKDLPQRRCSVEQAFGIRRAHQDAFAADLELIALEVC